MTATSLPVNPSEAQIEELGRELDAIRDEVFSSLGVLALGTVMLGPAKIIENMEIAHNVLHAQRDWMKDPNIQSNTWEWYTMSPSDRWMHSHNVVHHTWTNVVGKDLDVGYGILRVTPLQK